jgi:D-glycero-D-manno-heptose 1,7-bisphosphate phosphatase
MCLYAPNKNQKRGVKDFFWPNLDIVQKALTVVFGALAALIALFDFLRQIYLLFWKLTTVTLFATSACIVHIRRIRLIEMTTQYTVALIDELAHNTQQQFTALQERLRVNNGLNTQNKMMEFDQRIKSSKQILVCGLTLSSVMSSHYYTLIDSLIEQGTKLQIILLNPDSDQLDMFAKNFALDITSNELGEQIKESLSVLIDLYEKHPNAQLEVKLFDADMPFSIFAIDPEEPGGIIQSEMHAHTYLAQDRPHIELYDLINDQPRFQMFYEEFGRRWASSSQIIPFTSYRFALSEPEAVLGRPVVFLDRDGVINESAGEGKYVTSVQDFHFKTTSMEAMRKLLEKNFYVIIVTNQACIGRGLVSLDSLDEIHTFLLKETRIGNAHIQAVYICPHIPEANCSCRKPRAGLLRRACAELKINPEHTIFIGDSDSDIIAGKDIGCKTIRIQETSTSLTKVDATYRAATLSDAVTTILQLRAKLTTDEVKFS